jgi:hypothetical protein
MADDWQNKEMQEKYTAQYMPTNTKMKHLVGSINLIGW